MNKVVYALRIVPLSTLSDPEPLFRGQCTFKANILQTVDPIHSMLGSSPGFWGSADRMALFPVQCLDVRFGSRVSLDFYLSYMHCCRE